MLLEDVTSSSDCNPARRFVIGSPILTRIKYCEGIFDKPSKRNPDMPESPLFVPKKNKSLPRAESGQSSMEEHTSSVNEPYTSGNNSSRDQRGMSRDQRIIPRDHRGMPRDPYENVVITSRPYTCSYDQRQFYKYTPKSCHDQTTAAKPAPQYQQHVPSRPYQTSQPRAYRDHYENTDHVFYSAQHRQSFVSYYPQRDYVKYVPHRTVPPTPRYLAPPHYPPRTRMLLPHNASPGFDTTTSGYSSSYEQKTLSLNRGPSLPAMTEEIPVPSQTNTLPTVPTLNTTFDKHHHKFLLDRSILRQYFCIALSACIMCPPCGYWALYQAFKVDDMVDNGNYLGAERLARKIKRYSIVMFCVGLFWVSLTIGIFFLLLNKFKN